MTRKLTRTASALAGLAAALLLLPAEAGAAPLTIKVISVSTAFVTHDTGKKGASKGDTIHYGDKLLNAVPQFGKRKGDQVGKDSGVTTFSSAHAATFKGTAELPGGTLNLDGPLAVLNSGGLVIPVTGGTGKFAKATGTLTVAAGNDRVLNTYRLVLPSLPVA